MVSIVVTVLFTVGCRQDMHDQPKYQPLEQSAFFVDQQASRSPVPGTVARGQLNEDALLYTGKIDGADRRDGVGAGSGTLQHLLRAVSRSHRQR
jgi:hypothetical protein